MLEVAGEPLTQVVDRLIMTEMGKEEMEVTEEAAVEDAAIGEEVVAEEAGSTIETTEEIMMDSKLLKVTAGLHRMKRVGIITPNQEMTKEAHGDSLPIWM